MPLLPTSSDGSDVDTSQLAHPDELELYAPPTHDGFDAMCGTSNVAPYAEDGPRACEQWLLGGNHDTTFEQCMQAINCAMNKEMRVEYNHEHEHPPRSSRSSSR